MKLINVHCRVLGINIENDRCTTTIVAFKPQASLLWDIANRIAPDVTPQNAASHLGLFCLLREFSSKNLMKFEYHS